MTSMARDNNLFALEFNWLLSHVQEPVLRKSLSHHTSEISSDSNVHLAHAELLFNVHEKPFVTDGEGSRSLIDSFIFFSLYSFQSQRVRLSPSLTDFMKHCSHQLTKYVVKISRANRAFQLVYLEPQYDILKPHTILSHTPCPIPLWWIRQDNHEGIVTFTMLQ